MPASQPAFLLLCLSLFLTGCVSEIAASRKISALHGYRWKREGRIYYVGLFGTAVTDEELAELARSQALGAVRELNLGETRISDNGLACLRHLPEVNVLWLQYNKVVGDEGMEHVATLRELCSLDLQQTSVSDAGVARLVGLSQLRSLDLSGTRVTDGVIESLRKMPALRSVYLGETAVTAEGAEQIRAVFDCRVSTQTEEERREIFMKRVGAGKGAKRGEPAE